MTRSTMTVRISILTFKNQVLVQPTAGGNEAGTGAWRLLDCHVTRACRSDGLVASSRDEDELSASRFWKLPTDRALRSWTSIRINKGRR